MRRKIMPGVMAAFLFVPLSAFTQTTEQPEWCNEYVSGVNKEQACQIAIPFADEQQAMNLAIEESTYYKTLNGIHGSSIGYPIRKTGPRMSANPNMM